MTRSPAYVDLPRPDDGTGLPLSWGVWGTDDQLGMLNNITEASVSAAARLVRRGRRFNLNLPLHLPLGILPEGAHSLRRGPKQTLYKSEYAGLAVRDDKVELYPQASTQWDGLTHCGDLLHGFYNGVQDAQVTQADDTRNGIDQLAAFGIAARGILIDLPGWYRKQGRTWAPVGSQAASAEDVAAWFDAQGVSLRPGDILLVRTGWLRAFLDATEPAERERLFRGRDYSGLSGREDMWQFLWDAKVAAVVSDAVTVEAWPLTPGEPSLHWAIARLGLTLGELFDLEALAADSVETNDWTCFFTSMPLNLRGGVGSPPNAMALR